MYVKKIKDTTSYEAPNHQKCHSLRLSGFEEYGPAVSYTHLTLPTTPYV